CEGGLYERLDGLRSGDVAKDGPRGEGGGGRDHEGERRKRGTPSPTADAAFERGDQRNDREKPAREGDGTALDRSRERTEVGLVGLAHRASEERERRNAEALQRDERDDYARDGRQRARRPQESGRR